MSHAADGHKAYCIVQACRLRGGAGGDVFFLPCFNIILRHETSQNPKVCI